MLGVHAAPGLDDGPGIIPLLNDEELRALLAPAEADLVIVGHTHVPLDRTIDQMRLVNLGSISNPMRSRLEATYALLQAGSGGYDIQLRYVDYDRQAVVHELQRIKHPTVEFLTKMLYGEILPPWAPRK
jgi:diadenosine tetraphosphatase ApaH/serine/threonine PP2A family protein phosphatase